MVILNILQADEFTKKSKNNIVIDVRAPLEFSKGHIPGATNIPLFNDVERAAIGTLYKQSGRMDSVLYGLDVTGPKLKSFLEEIVSQKNAHPDQDILLHCARGGLRSQSVAWLLEVAGLKAKILESGYKAYRGHVLSTFQKDYKVVLLSGETGCGKTAILHELKKNGEQIIDLEGLANHKGSVFGGVGKTPQPTTQQFENNLAFELDKLDPTKRIWFENESPGIGSIHLPKDIVAQMRTAPIVQITVPAIEREKRIIREYGNFNIPEMEILITKLKKYLGGPNCEKAIEGLHSGNLHDTVSVLLSYYDKAYGHYQKKYNEKSVCFHEFEHDHPAENALTISASADKMAL